MTPGERMVWAATFSRECAADPAIARRAAVIAHVTVKQMRAAMASMDGSEADGVQEALLEMLGEYAR